MAAKNRLKYARNRLPGLRNLLDDAIDKCLHSINRPDFKPTYRDLIRLIRLHLDLQPPKRGPVTVRWIDQLRT